MPEVDERIGRLIEILEEMLDEGRRNYCSEDGEEAIYWEGYLDGLQQALEIVKNLKEVVQ